MTLSKVSKSRTAVARPLEQSKDYSETPKEFLPVSFIPSTQTSTGSNSATVIDFSGPVVLDESAWTVVEPPGHAREVYETCSYEHDEEAPDEDTSAAAQREGLVGRSDANTPQQALLLIQGYTLSRTPSQESNLAQTHILRKTKSPISRPLTPRSKDATQPFKNRTVPKTDTRGCCRWKMEDQKHLMLMEWLGRQG